jgi:mono/diheme cytochrome c family protein
MVGLAMALVATGVHAQDPPAGSAKGAKVDGATLYKEKCQVCHQPDGNSPIPHMSFADGVWLHGSTVKEVVHTITEGVPGTAMMSMKAQGLTDDEILALAKYVRHFDKNLDKGGAAKAGAAKSGAKKAPKAPPQL